MCDENTRSLNCTVRFGCFVGQLNIFRMAMVACLVLAVTCCVAILSLGFQFAPSRTSSRRRHVRFLFQYHAASGDCSAFGLFVPLVLLLLNGSGDLSLGACYRCQTRSQTSSSVSRNSLLEYSTAKLLVTACLWSHRTTAAHDGFGDSGIHSIFGFTVGA